MLTIRKTNYGQYIVHDMNTIYSDHCYSTLSKAIDLCRLRCNTNLKENKIKVIKVPFIGLWLVWQKGENMENDIKKCFCETLKERLGNNTGVGEEIKDFTSVQFSYDEEGNPMYGGIYTCMYYWKTNNYTLNINTEFKALDIPINYCPFCGRKLN